MRPGSSGTHPNRTVALLETEKAVKEKGLSYACRNGPIHQYSEVPMLIDSLISSCGITWP